MSVSATGAACEEEAAGAPGGADGLALRFE